MDTEGVYIGRFNPLHIGHESVIHAMMENHGRKNCVVMVGSCNAPYSSQNMFSYGQRRDFIKSVFPNLRIVGIPDFNSHPEWVQNVDDILRLAGIEPRNAVFYGGDATDLQMRIFGEYLGRKTVIVDRTAGSCQMVSGTGIRNALVRADLTVVKSHVNPVIVDKVIEEALWGFGEQSQSSIALRSLI